VYKNRNDFSKECMKLISNIQNNITLLNYSSRHKNKTYFLRHGITKFGLFMLQLGEKFSYLKPVQVK
jgi:hypothetical protein